MNFHSPHLLWLLVPLVLLFSWDLARRVGAGVSRWPKIARAWAGAFDVSLGTRHSTAETRPRLWLWFGLALCVIALARPQWGVVEEKVFDQSREVLIAVDLSRSMLAQDVKPSRLERSKLLITSLLDSLKGERVGLVLFAGTAFLQSPLSADYEILREFLPALDPNYLPEGGSNYKAMLETSIQAFGTSTADRYLIILSDGESTEEGWKDLGDALKTKGIRVIGLGIGTAQGSFIPDGAGGFAKDERGAVVLSRLDSSTLQHLAQTTGGAYTDASSWIDLPALLQTTVEAGRKGEFSERNTARLIERFQWFLAPGLLLLLLSFWAEFPVRPRERALPLGAARRGGMLKAERGMRQTTTAAALAALFWLSAFSVQPSASAQAQETPSAPDDTLAKPLTATVARLAAKDGISAKDFSELAQTTITYGQRLKTGQQPAPEGVVRDGLAAVDRGEKLDARAADWPRLRQELEALLEKPEPPKQDEQQQQQQDQQQKDQQQKQDQQNQDQQQQQQDQSQSEQQQQQQDEKQEAFGDMKEQEEKDQQSEEERTEQPPPQPQTQKVGGQKEKKEEQVDPTLAVPLQKLEQVRNQDSPAKLQQLMQGQPQKQSKKGKDW